MATAAAAAAAVAEESSPRSSSFPPTEMTRISRHSFGESGRPHAFTLEIIENMQEDYGMFIWPCSIALAEYVWQQRSQFSGATVIELGAGTSLPGLVAAKVGAEVILTDDSSRLEEMGCCTFASHNCAVPVMGVMGWDPMMDEVFTDLPWMCSFGAIIIGRLTVFAQGYLTTLERCVTSIK